MLARALLNAIIGLVYARVLAEGRPDRGRPAAGAGMMAALTLFDYSLSRRLREAEEQDARDAEIVGPPRLLDGVVYGELEDARHRAYRAPHVLPDGHEHRVDKVLRREPRLAHEAAERGRATGPSESLRGERHENGPVV